MAELKDSVKLDDLERAVYSREYEKAANILYKLLINIDVRQLGLVVSGQQLQEADRANLQLQALSRFAGCITALIADPAFRLNQSGFLKLMAFKRQMTAVFMASGYQDMNHLLSLVGQQGHGDQVHFRGDEALRKLVLVLTLSVPRDKVNPVDLIGQLSPELAVPCWLSFIDAEIVLGKSEAAVREQVAMSYEKLPESYQLPESLLPRTVNTWMFTSYMDFPGKHQPKKYLNKLLRRYGEQQGIREPRLPSIRKKPTGKPRLLVLSEHFRSGHAMHRCYRKAIESLREHFHTTCLCIDTTIDLESEKSFDEVITFKADEPLRKIAGRIAKRQPDVIYYPSLGMQDWTVVMAQFRFAPVQLMTMGHPATSLSPVIDYGLMRDADPELHSEKLVCGFKVTHVPYSGDFDFAKLDSGKEGVLVAVNAKNYKINHRLIEACLEIQRQANVPVHFRFFPNCRGITLEAFQRELGRHLDAESFPSTSFGTYIDRLRRCDLVLNPFPFGNTNGIIDCAQIGLPFVCMNGPELHSRIDCILSEQLGFPAFCRAESLDEYIAAATRLVNDANLRQQIQHEVLSEKRVDRIFDDSVEETDVLFGDSVYDIYQLHDSLQTEDQRRFDVKELAARAAASH